MNILIADDDAVSRRGLEVILTRAQYQVTVARDGTAAWEILRADQAPPMAILDWMMPGLDGIEICRKVRGLADRRYRYLIVLTSKNLRQDVVAGFNAGADDYVTKPFDSEELLSRVRVGQRIITLEGNLAAKVDELQHALDHVKQLQGLLPICMYCKRIRNDQNTWQRLESYIEQHSDAMFSHGLCEECLAMRYPDYVEPASPRPSHPVRAE